MKMISKIAIVFLMLFGMVNAFAVPPSPTGKTTSTAVDSPPDTPIDNGLSILIIAALLLGIYVIYKHKLYRKASM